MALRIPVQKDIGEYEEKIVGKMSLRTLACVSIGFGSADIMKGYVDMLYVASSAAGHGVGKTLLKALEARMEPPFTVHASATAMPFFASQGYSVVRANTVVRSGVGIRNFLMRKD